MDRPRPTVEELERLLSDDNAGASITILPNGEIRAQGETMEHAPPLVERVAWAILQILHSNVPEDERPQGWADLSSKQEPLIRRAAEAAIALATADERERCAKIADAHKGAAAAARERKPFARRPDPAAWESISSEERGEDIAAEIIARNIRTQ